MIRVPGANPVPISGFPAPADLLSACRCLDGDVAEWLKAAVC